MLDSLKYAKILEDAGLTRKQAETHIRILSEALVGGDMVTKTDLHQVESKLSDRISLVEKNIEHLDTKIDRVEEQLNLRLDNLQTQIIVKLGALMTILFGSALGVAGLIFT